MVREEREEPRDVEEAEQIGRHPEQKLNVVDNVVGCGFSLGVGKSERGRFKGITS